MKTIGMFFLAVLVVVVFGCLFTGCGTLKYNATAEHGQVFGHALTYEKTLVEFGQINDYGALKYQAVWSAGNETRNLLTYELKLFDFPKFWDGEGIR